MDAAEHSPLYFRNISHGERFWSHFANPFSVWDPPSPQPSLTTDLIMLFLSILTVALLNAVQIPDHYK